MNESFIRDLYTCAVVKFQHHLVEEIVEKWSQSMTGEHGGSSKKKSLILTRQDHIRAFTAGAAVGNFRFPTALSRKMIASDFDLSLFWGVDGVAGVVRVCSADTFRISKLADAGPGYVRVEVARAFRQYFQSRDQDVLETVARTRYVQNLDKPNKL